MDKFTDIQQDFEILLCGITFKTSEQGDQCATTWRHWTKRDGPLKMLISCYKARTDKKTAQTNHLERHDELGHTETCYDVRSLFAYCSNKVSFCIYNHLMSSQVYENANFSYFASSSHQLKIFDFLDRFKCVTLKKIWEDFNESPLRSL